MVNPLLIRAGMSLAGKAAKGLFKGKKKSRRMSVDRKVKKLIIAKIDGKIMKAKYGPLLK